MKTLFAAILLAFSALCHAADYPGIVAFGDSLSDMGNRWFKAGMSESKIRATWVKQLAGPAMLNIPDFKVSGTTSYLGGTNYAVGGAGTEYTAQMSGERNSSQNLTQQISKRYLNPAFNTDGVKKDALHIIVIGANDLMRGSIGLDQIFSQWAGLEKVGVAVAQSTETQIQALTAAGVTHIVWGNIFDVAQAPAVRARAKILGDTQSAAYLGAITRAAVAHNKEMDAAMERLQKANPSLKLIKLDLHARFAEVAANPAQFGFIAVTSGANDSKHLFSADGLHPTPQGHRMLAEYAFGILTKTAPAHAGK